VPDKCSLLIEQFEENLVPDKCSFNFGKKKKAPGRREAIRRKRLGMLSDVVILLHDNTHTARKSSSGKSDAPPHTWDPNTFHSFNILCSDKCLNRFGDNVEK
ncbi:hypothetical protein AVEN_181401-1, partial [Araneus ventricosus]